MERCGERQGYQQKSSGAAGLNPCSLTVKEPLVERLVLGAAIDLESRPEFTIGGCYYFKGRMEGARRRQV